jgi:RecA-family ATPase
MNIDFTIFGDRYGKTAQAQHASLEELAEQIRITVRPIKEALPLVKFETFGTLRTPDGCLRHDANVIAVTGVEADYDDEGFSFEHAVEIAEKAGLQALIYTSPSHCPERPRWRIIAPFSEPLPPEQRAQMLGRLNGLYDGIFAAESWTLSQSYFFGRVDGSPTPSIAITDGLLLNRLDELDRVWRGKPNGAGNGAASPGYQAPLDEAAMIEAIVTGNAFHVPCVRLLGKWAHAGVPMMEAEERLKAAFESVFPPDRDARWNKRYADIPRVVAGIYGKEAQKQDERIEFTIGGGANGGTAPPDSEPAKDEEVPEQDTMSDPDPWADTCAADWAARPIPPREWIWEDWVPLGQCVGLYGVPGVRKTDLLLQFLMAASLGLPFCGSPLAHVRTYALFCEDTDEEIGRRMRRIADFYNRDLREFTGFHYASLVGAPDTEFVGFTTAGRMVAHPPYRFFEKRIEHHTANLAVLDTAPDFFGGDEVKRRQVTQFVRSLDGLAAQRHCAILFTYHPSKSGISSGTLDSGSTGWEGKVRARLTLHDPEANADDEDRTRPIRMLSDRRILTRAKSNYAPPGEEIELIFRNGGFDAVGPAPGLARGPMRDLAANAKFLELLDKVRRTGDYVNNSPSVPGKYAPMVFAVHRDRGGFTKAEFVRALRRLLADGRIRIVQAGPKGRTHPEIEPV